MTFKVGKGCVPTTPKDFNNGIMVTKSTDSFSKTEYIYIHQHIHRQAISHATGIDFCILAPILCDSQLL